MTSVSVLIASYRRVERLAACLDGVERQTRPADEVVVISHSDDPATERYVNQRAQGWPQIRAAVAQGSGSVAAYNTGLRSSRGSIIAFVDDDAVPHDEWLGRIVRTFEQDGRIAGVGGRDIVIVDGRVEFLTSARRLPDGTPLVGRVQWFGRITGNHHVGAGRPRDVDVLKGVNMSFRRAEVEHGFDERLRGRGAVVHSEVSICLPLRKRGLRVVYDPEIVVMHYPAPRPAGDHRRAREAVATADITHNETLAVLDYLGFSRRVAYGVWWLTIGSGDSPGAAVLIRDVATKRPGAWRTFATAQRARRSALRTFLLDRRGALRGVGRVSSETVDRTARSAGGAV
jgi:GT2 family glycosyltransferase